MDGESAAEPATQNGLDAVEAMLGHRFADRGLLVEALTHPSLEGAERGAARHAYQRLEFLGDRVIGLVVADLLLSRFPEEAEGMLARRHTALVRQEMLAEIARQIGIGRHIRMTQSEQATGGRDNPTILSDALEALAGALLRDGGWDAARRFVSAHWEPCLDQWRDPPQDPKSALQEWAQSRALPLPVYEVTDRDGPPHQPVFTVSVTVQGYAHASGTGGAKQVAEKNAARAFLERVGAPSAEEGRL